MITDANGLHADYKPAGELEHGDILISLLTDLPYKVLRGDPTGYRESDGIAMVTLDTVPLADPKSWNAPYRPIDLPGDMPVKVLVQ